jgi:hypothetical protein
VLGTRPFQPDPIKGLAPLERHPPRGGPLDSYSPRGGVTEWSLTPLRERHSARGNQRIYAPKGTPEAISPGGPLRAHRGGLRARSLGPGVAGPAAVRALSLGLTPSGMRALHGWDHPPLASHAVNALKDQTIGGVPSLTF